METKDLILRSWQDSDAKALLREERKRLSRPCIEIHIMNYDDIPLICRADSDESQKNIAYLKRQLDNQEKDSHDSVGRCGGNCQTVLQ